MPTALDLAFALFFAVGLAGAAALYFDPQIKRRIAAGVPNARLDAYRRVTIIQWALALLTLAVWRREGRPWAALGLVPAAGWRLYAGMFVVAAIAALVVRQNRSIRRLTPERLERLTSQLRSADMVLPRNAREYRWFMILSVTAGVCEELLYRGFLTWLAAAYVGLIAAVLLVSVAFGFGHAYQGWKGVVKTAVVGLVMSGIVIVGGSLLPAMVVHALADIAGGVAAYIVLTRTRQHPQYQVHP